MKEYYRKNEVIKGSKLGKMETDRNFSRKVDNLRKKDGNE